MTMTSVTSPATPGCTGCGGGMSSYGGGGCQGCGSPGGCGCGGSCGCGSGMRSPAGSFARPRFFAGQLLQDDDLAAIESYVAGKNRLHNRFLHGDGVVCGLDVSCHPCGGGSVMVGSGYALDCCGNDIVVPCREELDVLAMIRQLRTAANDGCDCGPCVPSATDASGTSSGTSSGAGDQSSDQPRESVSTQPQARRYWLYVRYTEQLSDPVEPYATDAACGVQGCELSRVREGYQFLLRSHRCCSQNNDIIQHVLDCLGPRKDLIKALGAGQWAHRFIVRLRAALGTQDVIRPGPADFTRAELGRVTSFATDAAGAPVVTDAASASQLIDDLTVAASTVLRAKALSDTDRAAAGLDDAQINLAATALTTAAEKLRAANVLDRLDPAVRPFAEASLRTAVRAADHPLGEPLPGDLSVLAKGVAADNSLVRVSADVLRQLKAWLLERAERAGATDCTLAAEVAAVRIPVITRTADGSEVILEDPGQADDLEATAVRLGMLTRRYLISCVCAAINPPCPSCTDDAVLLAGIDVLDCEVQSVCQVVRQNVPTGPALRYWLALERIPALLEKLCCPDDACEPTRPAPKNDQRRPDPVQPIETGFLAAGQASAPASDRDRVLFAVGQVLGGEARTGTPLASMLGTTLNPAALRTGLADIAVRNPQVRSVVMSIADQALQNIADQALQDQAQAHSQTTAKLAQLERTMQRRLAELDRQLAQVTTQLAQAVPAEETAAAKKAPAKKATPARKPAGPAGGGQP